MQLMLVLVQLRALLAAPIRAAVRWRAPPRDRRGDRAGDNAVRDRHRRAGVAWQGGARRRLGFGLALALGIVALLPIAGHGGACDTIAPLAPLAIAGGMAHWC